MKNMSSEKHHKSGRNKRFYCSVIIAIFAVFALVLMVSVASSYCANKRAYANALYTRADYHMTHMMDNINSYGAETVCLCNSADLIQLLSDPTDNANLRLLQEKKIADNIWNSMGQTDVFIGVTLEGTDGTFYLKNTRLGDFSVPISQIVDIQQLDFSANKYNLTVGTYKNDAVLVISSPIINANKEICGYLHMMFNHLIYGMHSTVDEREDYLFNADTGQVIACDGFINMTVCNNRIMQIPGLQEQLQQTTKHKNQLIAYTNPQGENMLGAIDCDGPFVMLTAVATIDMIRSIIPLTLLQLGISLLLMGLLSILVYLLFNRTTKPVTDMIKQCSRLANGEEVVAIGTGQDSDLNQLGEAFNSYRKQLEDAAYSDYLLGIGTRHKYIRDVDALIASGSVDTFSIFIIDIKEFSKYNDVFSIELGDQLLKAVATRLTQLFKNLYRINGDVFLGMLYQVSQQAEIAEEIHRLLNEQIILGSFEFEVQCRVSICSYPTHGTNATTLLEKAQSALHHTKMKSLSDTVIYNDEMIEVLRRENEILTLLLRRIADKTLEVWYQPIYHIASQEYRSAEALLRLKDDAGNYLPPFEVIEIAEKNNVVDKVGNYVLENTCQLLKTLDKLPKCNLQYIQVNLSVQELARNDFVSKALSLIESYGINPAHIGMEITETMVIQSFSGAITTLTELRNHSIYIAMDDFGSGYSGINYLSNLPCDILKLDRDLVIQVEESEAQLAFVKTVVDLAKIKQIKTVAEGVETKAMLEKIIRCDVDFIQGYYLSKPLCQTDLLTFIQKQQDLL